MCDRHFLKFEQSFENDFSVLVSIFLVYWQYKAMIFSLHYSIKYLFSRIIASQVFWIFLLMRLFSERFLEKVQHSIQMKEKKKN